MRPYGKQWSPVFNRQWLAEVHPATPLGPIVDSTFETPKPGGPKGQLYNLQDDFTESRNLWLERPDMVRKLTALLERIQRDGHSRPI
jgi:arylsulfatase A